MLEEVSAFLISPIKMLGSLFNPKVFNSNKENCKKKKKKKFNL